MGYREDFIEFMAEAGVLTFGDFITKSGRPTPYFINTGNYKTGAQISRLGIYYAAAIKESGESFDTLFGPAYKGIPLAVATAYSLYTEHGVDVPYCFNRKEAKDHGEGGSLVGYKPRAGDKIAVIEDVVTAGTALRESVSLLGKIADVTVSALFVSVDRMERGSGSASTLNELRDSLGIRVYPIVTVKDIMKHLHNRQVGGRVYIDDDIFSKMQAYLQKYGA